VEGPLTPVMAQSLPMRTRLVEWEQEQTESQPRRSANHRNSLIGLSVPTVGSQIALLGKGGNAFGMGKHSFVFL
jgi:hypothetical protein